MAEGSVAPTREEAPESPLRTPEKVFKIVAENSHDWVFWLDPEGTCIFCSPSCERVTGYPAQDYLTEPSLFREILHPDDRSLWDAHRHSRSPEAGVCDVGLAIQFRVRHRNGTERWVEHTCRPVFEDDDGYLGQLVNHRDITSQKRTEGQLRQAQKMESLGQLAGGIAHDFNNVLSASLMHLAMLQEDESLGPEVRNSIAELEEHTQKAVGLTRQLLLFSRRTEAQGTPINLNVVVNGLLKMLKRFLRENVRLDYEAAPSLPSIIGDPGMIEQVLLNLAVNARDAMPEGGVLSIRTYVADSGPSSERRSPPSSAPAWVVLSVSDTGCGIEGNALAQIFDPFFTTKTEGKGTGLGLATVRGIVNQHRGRIEVESRPGEGTTFRVFFPTGTPDRIGPAEESAGPSPGNRLEAGTETVLLVEDESGVRKMTAALLRGRGYQVFEAETGMEALGIWRERRKQIDLLLTDLIMPDAVSGLDLARRLQDEQPGLKVLLTSGYSADVMLDGVASNFRFLPKPYSQRSLTEAVRQCLDEGTVSL